MTQGGWRKSGSPAGSASTPAPCADICWAWFAGPTWLTVLVLETGVGAAATEAALTWALGSPLFGNLPYRPRLVLSAEETKDPRSNNSNHEEVTTLRAG